MVNLFQLIIAGCIILIIIGSVLIFVTDATSPYKNLGIGLFMGGVIGCIAIYLAKKYNIVNFD